jgi:cell division protein FtsB
MKTAQKSPIQYSILKITAFVFAAMLVFAFGCESQKAQTSSTTAKINSEDLNLRGRLEQCSRDNEQLKKQVETLSELPVNKRADAIYHLQAVKLGRYTNIYDKDVNSNSPGKKNLVVYVEPVDETGDAIKAAGAAEVQLWDLNKKENEALLGQWQIEPNEMKKLWLNSFLGGSYRLVFDVSQIVTKVDKPLTVKVNFTDYLSGKTFIEEKAIKP